MAIRNALIAVDFDGTVVTHAYPEIGDDAGAVPVLKELTDNGCRLILYTMRHGKLLDDAIRWFRERGIPLYAVNETEHRTTLVFLQLYSGVPVLGSTDFAAFEFEGGVLRAATVNLQRFAATGENRIVLPAKQAAASASAGERSMMAAYREENGVYVPSRFYLKDGKTD